MIACKYLRGISTRSQSWGTERVSLRGTGIREGRQRRNFKIASREPRALRNGICLSGNGWKQSGTYEQPAEELKGVLGSTPGTRGKSRESSWAFQVAGPCDPWCDRLVLCWGATKHWALEASIYGSSGSQCWLAMSGSQLNPYLSHTHPSAGVHSPGL